MKRRSLHEKNLLRKIFFSYIIILLIPMLFIGIYSYVRIYTILWEQSEQIYTGALERIRDTLDKNFSELDDLTTTLAKTSWLRKIALMNSNHIDFSRIDHSTLNDHINELDTYRALSGFIESFAIYISNKGLMLHANGIDTVDWFFSQKYCYKDITPDEWVLKMSELQPSKPPIVLISRNVTNYNVNISEVITYVKAIPIVDNYPRAVMFIMIKEQAVEELLRSVKQGLSFSVYLFDDRNEFIGGLDVEPEITELLEKQNLSYSNSIKTEKFCAANKKKYFVIYGQGTLNKWKYAIAVPINEVMKDMNNVKNITVVLYIFVFLGGLAFCYWFTKRDYKPLEKLGRVIEEFFSSRISNRVLVMYKHFDAYEYIEKGVEYMKSEIEDYKIITVAEGFRKLLNGQYDEIRHKKHIELIMKRYNKAFYAAVIFEPVDTDYLVLQERDILRINESLITSEWAVYLLKQEDKLLAVVNTQTNTRESLERAVEEVGIACRAELNAVAGGLYTIEFLWKSYNEAKVAMDYKLFKEHKKIIHYAEIEEGK